MVTLRAEDATRAGTAISLRRMVAVVALAIPGPVIVAPARIRPNAITASTSHAPLVVNFPDRNSAIRLIGAVLAEQRDDWAEGRRYLGLDLLARSGIALSTTDETTTQKEH